MEDLIEGQLLAFGIVGPKLDGGKGGVGWWVGRVSGRLAAYVSARLRGATCEGGNPPDARTQCK